MTGETVTVIRPVVARDDLGEPVYSEPVRDEVRNVLVAPGDTDFLNEKRPNGARAEYTCYFPKTFKRSLKGCSVEIRGEVFDVVGDPKPYSAASTPTDWNLPVEVVRVVG